MVTCLRDGLATNARDLVSDRVRVLEKKDLHPSKGEKKLARYYNSLKRITLKHYRDV